MGRAHGTGRRTHVGARGALHTRRRLLARHRPWCRHAGSINHLHRGSIDRRPIRHRQDKRQLVQAESARKRLPVTDRRPWSAARQPSRAQSPVCVARSLVTLGRPGSIPYFRTYPSLYVPQLLLRATENGTDLLTTSTDVLALSKMNWNNAQLDSRDPLTLRTAHQVGGILRHVRSDRHPLRLLHVGPTGAATPAQAGQRLRGYPALLLRDGGLLVGEFGIELAGECVQALIGPLDPAVAQRPPGHGFPRCD
jgi:hypothetical protein